MKKLLLAGLAFSFFGVLSTTKASILTFNDAISGATSYTFDSDGDGIPDVIFTTTDPAGFNTAGPGPNMTYINEPGLEGTSLLAQDLKVQFLNGAFNSLSFGFALDSFGQTDTMTFDVYDAGNNLLAASTQTGLYTQIGGGQSSFPEGKIDLSFGGKAAYATFDATSQAGRFIIDNFQGTFGSTEVPDGGATAALLGFGSLCLVAARKARR